jgi:hypothetical protein
MLPLEPSQVGAQRVHLLGDLEHAPVRKQRRRDVIAGPGLERQSADDGCQVGRVEAVPDALAQALADQQVELAVDALQPEAVGCHLVTVEVAEDAQHFADTVELPCHGVGSLLDAAALVRGVALELEVALGPASVGLPVRTGVARVLTERRPDLGDAGVLDVFVLAVRLVVAPLHALCAVPQRRSEVAAGLRVA